MTINVSERGRQCVSMHYMALPIANNRHSITRSGIAVFDWRRLSTSTRERLQVQVDLRPAIQSVQPRLPSAGHYWVLRPEQWVVYGGVESFADQGLRRNSGVAVDTFSLTSPQPHDTVQLNYDLVAPDTDVNVYRMGYWLELVGRLEEKELPGGPI